MASQPASLPHPHATRMQSGRNLGHATGTKRSPYIRNRALDGENRIALSADEQPNFCIHLDNLC